MASRRIPSRATPPWGRSVFVGLALLLGPHRPRRLLGARPAVPASIGGAAPGAEHAGAQAVGDAAAPAAASGAGRRRPASSALRTAMLSLLAVWLITAPCLGRRGSSATSAAPLHAGSAWSLFGLAFGTMMTTQGLWGGAAAVAADARCAASNCRRRCCSTCICAASRDTRPGHRMPRQAFDRLAWLVPLIVFGAVVVLGGAMAGGRQRGRRVPVPKAFVYVSGAVYGMLAMLVGVAASAAVASLAAAYFHAAFPMVRRWITSCASRRAARAALASASLPAGRLALFAIAAGAGLLVIVMMIWARPRPVGPDACADRREPAVPQFPRARRSGRRRWSRHRPRLPRAGLAQRRRCWR